MQISEAIKKLEDAIEGIGKVVSIVDASIPLSKPSDRVIELSVKLLIFQTGKGKTHAPEIVLPDRGVVVERFSHILSDADWLVEMRRAVKAFSCDADWLASVKGNGASAGGTCRHDQADDKKQQGGERGR